MAAEMKKFTNVFDKPFDKIKFLLIYRPNVCKTVGHSRAVLCQWQCLSA